MKSSGFCVVLNIYYHMKHKLKICNSSPRDLEDLCRINADLFFGGDFAAGEAYVNFFDVDYKHSVKLVDNGKTVGIMTMCNDGIDRYCRGSFTKNEPKLSRLLKRYRGITGMSLGLDEKYRGHKLSDKLVEAMLDKCQNFDYIVIPVANNLNTHTYWARYGVEEVYSDDTNSFYLLVQNKELKHKLDNIKGINKIAESVINRYLLLTI